MRTTGKVSPTNSPIFNDNAGIAALRGVLAAAENAAAIGAENARAVCLLPHFGIAGQVQQAVRTAQKDFAEASPRHPPLLVAVPALLRVVAASPALSVAQAIQIAAWYDLPPPHNDHRQTLRWRLYQILEDSVRAARVGRLQLAEKLADLFIALDHTHCITGNPFADPSAPDGTLPDDASHEWEVAYAVWALMAETPQDHALLLHHNALFAKLAANAPRGWQFFAITNAQTPPLHHHYFGEMGATTAHEADPPEVTKLAQYQPLAPRDPGVANLTDCIEANARSLNNTAQLALRVIQHWTADAADRRIGIVVYDRELARRLRSQAETQGLLIEDKTGWRLETLSIGAGMKLFINITLGAFGSDLIRRCLQAPYFAAAPYCDWRVKAQQEWQRMLSRDLTLPESLAEVLAHGKTADALQHVKLILQPLQDARADAPKRASVQEWMQWLARHAPPAMLSAWSADPLAQNVFARLLQVRIRTQLTADEFHLWMTTYLDEEVITTIAEVTSPVVFTSPTTWQQFDAIVLLGFDDTRRHTAAAWLGERENQLLGILTAHARSQDEQRHFFRLLAKHTRAACVWQSQGGAEETINAHPLWRIAMQARARQLPAPQQWTEESTPLLVDAAGDVAVAQVHDAAFVYPQQHAARAQFSMTALGDLMSCPYHFYAGRVLAFAAQNEQDEDDWLNLLSGNLFHRLLQQFADCKQDDFASLQNHWLSLVGAQTTNRNGLKHILNFWRVHAGQLAGWEQQRRAIGWRVRKTEYPVEWQLQADQKRVEFKGRIDRLDALTGMDEDQWAIIDYKSGSLPTQRELAQGERPQLWLYLLAFEQTSGFDNVSDLMLANPVVRKRQDIAASIKITAEQKKAIRTTLQEIFADIQNSVPLPANGITKTCKDCASAVLCRKEHWQRHTMQPPIAQQQTAAAVSN